MSEQPGDNARAMPALARRQWRQIALLTLGAVALYSVFRVLPTGTNLNHVDFRVAGANSLEMCDPSNPQFIPVVAVRSPVSMTVATMLPPRAGAEVAGVLTLKTASGKPIGPADLLVTHTRKLHLLIVDPTLTDYQHVHPEAAKSPGGGEAEGAWNFVFTPRGAGVYRIFADFTPVATGRGLYASADVEVAAAESARAGDTTSLPAKRAGLVFTLDPATGTIRAGQPAELAFGLSREDGSAVALEPVMGAWAHLVAFDEARTGFAHLHPNEIDPAWKPDARRPRLTFKVTIPRVGRYAIWAQVRVDGREMFAPFWFDVAR